MDDVDGKIIGCLRANSREKHVKIAKRLGVTEGTVRNRISRMIENGTIQKFTIKASSGIEAMVMRKRRKTDMTDIIKEIRRIAEEMFEVTGDYDIVAIIGGTSIEELNQKIDKIRSVKGVIGTNTAVKLHQN